MEIVSPAIMVWGPGGSGAEEWIRKLRDNDPTFRELHVLSFRRLTEDDVVAICEALAGTKHLELFAASGQALSARALEAVSSMLAVNTSLRKLAVGDNSLGDKGIEAIVPGLAKNQTLVALDAEHKCLGLGAAAALSRVLAVPSSNLGHLNLARNQLDDEALSALCDGLQGNTHLTRLDLADNLLTALALPKLAAALPRCRVGNLNLSGNKLGTESGDPAVGLLMDESPLRELCLDRCGLQGTADALFSGGLGRLSRLSVRDCGIDAVGVASLATGLERSTTLESLDISENPLGDAGMAVIVQQGFSDSSQATVVRLSASRCSLGVDSLAALLGAAGSTMTHLNLFANNIGDAVHRLVEAGASHPWWSSPRGLVDLDIGGNGIGDE